ncbi:3-dehydroquinate synthase [Spirochaeta dissipatitropha]
MTLNVDKFSTAVHFGSTRLSELRCDLSVYDSVMAAAPHGVKLPPGDLTLQADEQHKTWDTVTLVLQTLLDRGVARDGSLLAVGGGVLCDLSAFAASIYMRGINCILVPSTLLSMVDAAFGGKTGMNFGGYKNMIGTFYPASELIIEVDFLRSLPDYELQSGMGEVFKAALLDSGDLWKKLRKHAAELMDSDRRDDSRWETDRYVWEEIIREALAIKGSIVEADFRESGQRAFLNLGHTFGHAAESVLGFGTIPHGTLVVWGILCALKSGLCLGKTPQSYYDEVYQLAIELGYPEKIKLPDGKSIEDLISAMRSDKKKRDGQVRFVLQHGQADTFQEVVSETVLREVLAEAVLS